MRIGCKTIVAAVMLSLALWLAPAAVAAEPAALKLVPEDALESCVKCLHEDLGLSFVL